MAETTRTIGYICPECKNAVIISRTVFQLAAGASRLACPCGKSAIELQPFENDIQVTVPCVYCGTEHTATCSNDTFFKKKAAAFSCAGSGINCCVVGEEGCVVSEMQKLEKSIDAVSNKKNNRGSFLNEVIMHEILSEIKDIASRGAISCSCGSLKYGMKISYSCVDIKCSKCGGTLRVPAASADDLEQLCSKSNLVIKGN